MADVYVLASPTPTLYVYPSALHVGEPESPAASGGFPFAYAYPPRHDDRPRRRKHEDEPLLALGSI